jgi:dTDP-4-dehydrorhamnose 3,5-epimerase-like enzyme
MFEITEFDVKGDHRGSLISLETGSHVPFEIKRVYYIFGTTKNTSRGFHAHRELEQLIVAVSGSCDFVLDDGSGREQVTLASPNVGLYITGNVWREMHNFSSDCVLMVLASNIYDERDYIRDYSTFLKEVNNVSSTR